MNVKKIIEFVNIALNEADRLVETSLYYKNDNESIMSTKLVLNLLKQSVQKDSNNINIRILRAMHDLGMSSYKDFEDTPLETAIGNVTEMLYKEMPGYKKLQPLRMEFGKGDPI